MKIVNILAIMILSMFLLVACGTADEQSKNVEEETKSTVVEGNGEANPYPQLYAGQNNIPTVDMITSKGTITIELYPEIAPKAVENFLTHSKNGFYNGLTFHRVMNEFMIQGGDPLGNGTGGESIYGAPFEDEFSDKLYHFRGALSMANSGANTNQSQFFIVQKTEVEAELQQQMIDAGFPKDVVAAYSERGGTPWLDFKHTVFGQVVEGMEVVDAIASVEVDANSMPTEPVLIEEIVVHE
ncbi:peptidylprolyl isomerase [Bacillus salitolerans]|uniref:Peptidyl-prolyl cis-trans isomerase n=1 Tax=Bacillus salitolerans TaxID=1437434 RepID=A0ABW4LMT0_9BACI